MTAVPDDVLAKYAGEMLDNERTREQIANQTVDAALWAKIKDAVTVDDKTVSVEDFNKLFGAPEAEA